jgi:hypothetical protein
MRNDNRQWRLAAYPEGMPKPSDWVLGAGPIPEPGPGEMLVRARYLDVAPYMRGRIHPAKNYAAGVEIGQVMVGGAVGEIVRSHCPGFEPGAFVVTDFEFGWQDYALLRPAQIRRVDPALAPLPCWLDTLGLNGCTAYFGLLDVGAVRPGDTVLVSAAAGSVGLAVGQLAKIAGARAIGVTSSDVKAAGCREFGYDAVVNYRTAPDLAAAMARACPDGIDVFFDNTGGPIHDAALQNLRLRARVVLCGVVSRAAEFGQPDIGPRYTRNLLMNRARMEGFIVMDYADRYAEAARRLGAWHRAGQLRYRHDVASGIEQLPHAFLRLLTSANFGKQLVRIDD